MALEKANRVRDWFFSEIPSGADNFRDVFDFFKRRVWRHTKVGRNVALW